MIYHILDHNDFERLKRKKCIFINNADYSYNIKITRDKFLKKYQIDPTHLIVPISKSIIDKCGGEDTFFCNADSYQSIETEGFRFYIYDTKEFWKEELKINNFKEIEI